MISRKYSFLTVFFIFVGVLIGLVISSNLDWMFKGFASDWGVEPREIALGSNEPISQELVGLQDLSKAFVEVSRDVSPAVVTISSKQIVKHPFAEDEFMRRFFRIPDQEQEMEGLGSGVIVNPDGYILTNDHVIKSADEITVIMDKKEFDAKVIGKDPLSDLAVIKIDAKNLPTIKLGDSENLLVGEWVLAIGNPFNKVLQHTVTAGIVSAKGRSNLPISGQQIAFQDYIQTDAAINPGNSGGALVNLRGELVGINAAIVGQSNSGIGFAIPINMAKNVMRQLIEKGRVSRGYLGLFPQTVDASLANAYGLKEISGALVAQVESGTPAEKAGIKAGDIILRINDQKVEDADQLRNMTASYMPGTKVTMLIWRDKNERQITVTLGERPGEEVASEEGKEPSEVKLGIKVESVTDELRQRLELERDDVGVVVTEVTRTSIAYRKGLRTGDLITSINQESVQSVRDFNRLVGKVQPGDSIVFRVKRGGYSRFIAFEVPKN